MTFNIPPPIEPSSSGSSIAEPKVEKPIHRSDIWWLSTGDKFLFYAYSISFIFILYVIIFSTEICNFLGKVDKKFMELQSHGYDTNQRVGRGALIFVEELYHTIIPEKPDPPPTIIIREEDHEIHQDQIYYPEPKKTDAELEKLIIHVHKHKSKLKGEVK